MTLHVALAAGALAAAVLLTLLSSARVLGGLAAATAALELAMALGLLRFHVAGVPLGLLLPLGLAVPGLVAWLRASSKPAVSAAAIVAFVGIVQLALHVTARQAGV